MKCSRNKKGYPYQEKPEKIEGLTPRLARASFGNFVTVSFKEEKKNTEIEISQKFEKFEVFFVCAIIGFYLAI